MQIKLQRIELRDLKNSKSQRKALETGQKRGLRLQQMKEAIKHLISKLTISIFMLAPTIKQFYQISNNVHLKHQYLKYLKLRTQNVF
jgi:hypothetical protein